MGTREQSASFQSSSSASSRSASSTSSTSSSCVLFTVFCSSAAVFGHSSVKSDLGVHSLEDLEGRVHLTLPTVKTLLTTLGPLSESSSETRLSRGVLLTD